jgi:hypothetical protein
MVVKRAKIWSNKGMSLVPEALKSMPPSEVLSEIERLLEVMRQQHQGIEEGYA